MTYHETLGVSPDASDAEIQRAYRRAAKEAHPDHSNSPEAAEAFQRIKEARDALLGQERAKPMPPLDSIKRSAAHAAQATAAAAFTPPTPPPMTDEELARVQELDQQAARKRTFSLFRRVKESAELRRHRHRIKTNNRRLDGKY
jgi:DnaJ domain